MKKRPVGEESAFLEGGLRTSSSQTNSQTLAVVGRTLSWSGDNVPQGLVVSDALFDPGETNFGARPFNICRMPGPNSWRRLMPASLPIVEPKVLNVAEVERLQSVRRLSPRWWAQPALGSAFL